MPPEHQASRAASAMRLRAASVRDDGDWRGTTDAGVAVEIDLDGPPAAPSTDLSGTDAASGGTAGSADDPDGFRALSATLRGRHPTLYERYVKPPVDRVVAMVLCALLAPVMLAAAITVLVALGRPVLLRQERVGRDGRVFRVIKFRTMRPDRRSTAPGAFNGWHGEDRRVTHKHPNDPRLVPVGRFLRRWSVDELPQLLNVVLGHMSLVGPRPEVVGIVDRYRDWQHARHLVKPGVTGLWQVSERGNGEMHERVDVDLEYVRRLSFRTDLVILLRTVPAALGFRKGF